MTNLPEIDSLWNYADPKASEERFRNLLTRTDLPPTYRAESLTQLSRACCLQRNHAEARRVLDEAKLLLLPDMNRQRIRYLLESGRLDNELGVNQSGASEFEKAWELASQCGEDVLAVDAGHMLGYISHGPMSVHWHTLAIAKAEASQDNRAKKWVFRLSSNLGKKLVKAGQLAEALEVYEKAIRWCETHDASVALKREARWNIAYALRVAGQTEKALSQLCELESQIQAAGDPPDGYVFEEIAECLLAMNRAPEAATYFAKAYELHIKDPWFPPTEPDRLERIRTLSGK